MGLSPNTLAIFLIKNPKRWKIVVNLIYWEYLLYANLRKNIEKWKKHSVLIFFPCHDLNQNSSTSDLSFSQVTEVGKSELRKSFLRLRQRRSREMFPKFPFSYWGNLGKTQIRREEFFPKAGKGKILKQNAFFILLAFS